MFSMITIIGVKAFVKCRNFFFFAIALKPKLSSISKQNHPQIPKKRQVRKNPKKQDWRLEFDSARLSLARLRLDCSSARLSLARLRLDCSSARLRSRTREWGGGDYSGRARGSPLTKAVWVVQPTERARAAARSNAYATCSGLCASEPSVICMPASKAARRSGRAG